MTTLRLNALAIRTNNLPVKPPVNQSSGLLDALGGEPLLISRRDLLKIAGFTVAAGAIASKSLQPITHAETGVGARGAWLRAGADRALLDPAAFSGSPRLTLSTNGSWRALLENARYPGTDIPAGMALVVLGTGLLSRLRIRHEFAGFEADVPLASWLSGETAADAVVRLGRTLVLGDGHRLTLSGLATATLRPDWSLRLEGHDIARLTGLGKDIVASALTIGLAGAEAPSLIARRIARRTLITLESGSTTWTVPMPALSGGRALGAEQGALDRVTIEAAETGAGAVYRAVVAFSSGEGAAAYTAPASEEDAGTPVPVTNLRMARLLDGSGSFHVAADFAAPTWIRALGLTLSVGGASWTAPLEIFGNSLRHRVNAEPAVSGIAVDLPGAIASPLQFPAGARWTAHLGSGGKGAGARANGAMPILGKTSSGAIVTPLPTGTYVNILRPDDLLTLRLRLFNMSIATGRTGRKILRRSNPNVHAYISVTFPGQHVVERAYMDSQTPGSAPFQAYLADESRLGFQVADALADTGIDYSLTGPTGDGKGGLLDWSEFTHVVVPVASPVAQGTDRKSRMFMPREGSEAVIGPMLPPETSLEVPWGLYMSPESGAWWSHRIDPLTKNARTELWHTRLHGAMYSLPPYVLSAGETAGRSEGITGGVGGGFIPPISKPPGWILRERSATLRAVWSRHYDTRLTADTPVPDAPVAGLFRNSFTTSLTDNATVIEPGFPLPRIRTNDIGGIQERWSITDLSGRYHYDPINVDLLFLTSLGAWMNSRASWKTDEIAALPRSVATELLQWDHRMTMGRDQYVKIVKFGRLFPFGHKAVKITITERKVNYASPFAFLEQKTFIMVRQPVIDYSLEADPIKRGIPFKRVEIKTRQTPPISGSAVAGVSKLDDAFWPKVVATGTDVQWVIEATDWDDRIHRFTMPLIYVRGYIAGKYDTNVPYNDGTSGDAESILRACASAMETATPVDMKGQSIAYAKNWNSEQNKARVLPTKWMNFSAHVFDPPVNGDARFVPLMFKANVQLDAVEELTNQKAGTIIKIAQQYRDFGFTGDNAAGKVFAQIPSAPSLGFPAELTGALATPIPTFSGISALQGPIGGAIEQIGKDAKFDPAELFTILDAKIIGGITLISILEALLDLDKQPAYQMVKDALDADTVIVSFDWETKVKSSDTPDKAIFLAETGSMIKLHAKFRKKIKNASEPPTSEVTGELGPFTLQLLATIPAIHAIDLKFDKLSFSSINGASPTVSPIISDVKFVGAFAYLQELAKYLGPLGGGGGSPLAADGVKTDALTVVDEGPFKIDVDTSGIKASLTLQLPDITIGVFSLKNMSFSAALTLPFDGTAVLLDFGFCSRESPFELLVMCFGGGGYVLAQIATDGLRMIEIALEFGAGTAFSIGGIASGSVEIKGGLSFRYDKKPAGDELTFKVYIRIKGCLRVLGLISVTLTFYLELSYHQFVCPAGNDGDELTGTATLTIEIEILFFSIAVELSVTKTLAGSDPRFGDMMPEQSDWDAYCAAFSPARLGA